MTGWQIKQTCDRLKLTGCQQGSQFKVLDHRQQSEPGPLGPLQDFTQKHTRANTHFSSQRSLIMHHRFISTLGKHSVLASYHFAVRAGQECHRAPFNLIGSRQPQTGRGIVSPAAKELGALQPRATAHWPTSLHLHRIHIHHPPLHGGQSDTSMQEEEKHVSCACKDSEEKDHLFSCLMKPQWLHDKKPWENYHMYLPDLMCLIGVWIRVL